MEKPQEQANVSTEARMKPLSAPTALHPHSFNSSQPVADQGCCMCSLLLWMEPRPPKAKQALYTELYPLLGGRASPGSPHSLELPFKQSYCHALFFLSVFIHYYWQRHVSMHPGALWMSILRTILCRQLLSPILVWALRTEIQFLRLL